MIAYELQGLRFSLNDIVISEKPEEIKKGDLIILRDTNSNKSGYLLISDQNFKCLTNNSLFNFKHNENYFKGKYTTGINNFCYKVLEIKKLDHLIESLGTVIKKNNKKITVKDKYTGELFLVEYYRKSTISLNHLFRFYKNKTECDFPSLGEGYPKHSKHLKIDVQDNV